MGSETGDAVFLGYSQAELDRQYDQSQWSKCPPAAYSEQYLEMSAAARTAVGEPVLGSYGQGEVEKIDIFPAAKAGSPVLLFIHGGAWRGLDRRHGGYAAEYMVRNGITYGAVDFSVMPGVDMPTMIGQLRRAVAWVHANAHRFCGDPDRIYIAGHSSGAHMAGCAVTTDWACAHGLPTDVIKGALLCSGGYDLEPVRLSARNSYMHLTPEMVRDYSPTRNLDRLGCPVVLAAGERESPDFFRQSRDLAAALDQPLHVATDLDHFEVSLTLARPGGLLADLALDMIHGPKA
ncbi:alpha/beta hydrolase [Chachezhania sediminis]|uniref:alpha/beta hydrolase n=1 Tax=Chachezhania sediminis TaxID=2599291 RepID=UPI00131A6AA3|nr:alpha/beta hydrolase [Chachezhania sediminis]